jgi:hypothetical protein
MPEDIDRELDAFRARIKVEIRSIEDEIVRLRERSDGLRKTLGGVEAVLGIRGERLKGAEAVARVAWDAINEGNAEDRDGALTIPEIVEELRQRDWLPDSDRPEGAVRSAIRRLRDTDPRWGIFQGRLYYHDRPLPSETDREEDDS